MVAAHYNSIEKIRQLLFAEKYKGAQNLSNAAFPWQVAADNNYGMPCQTVNNFPWRLLYSGRTLLPLGSLYEVTAPYQT